MKFMPRTGSDVRKAIEQSVLEIIKEGEKKKLWEYKQKEKTK